MPWVTQRLRVSSESLFPSLKGKAPLPYPGAEGTLTFTF